MNYFSKAHGRAGASATPRRRTAVGKNYLNKNLLLFARMRVRARVLFFYIIIKIKNRCNAAEIAALLAKTAALLAKTAALLAKTAALFKSEFRPFDNFGQICGQETQISANATTFANKYQSVMAIHFKGRTFDKDHPATEADLQDMLDWTQEENDRKDKEARKTIDSADIPLYERWEADQQSVSECGHL